MLGRSPKNMTRNNLNKVFELAEIRDLKHYTWIRQLVLMSSGSLTALVAFPSDPHSTGMALLFLRIGWVSLGCSILLGALSLHGEVSMSSALVKDSVAKAREQSLKGEAWTEPVVSNKKVIYKVSEFLFYSSLFIAVISLVIHAVLRG
jgi:hypothetical protein